MEKTTTTTRELLNEILTKMSRLEAHLEHQKETVEKLQTTIASFESLKREVYHHGLILKAITWISGIAISFFTARFLNKVLS
jgi:uncharacterized membrane-anchored protein YhcB (DUF1043 family)